MLVYSVLILLLDHNTAMPTGLMTRPATWREFFRPRLPLGD